MSYLHTSADRCKLPRVFWQSIEQLGLDPSWIQQHAQLPDDLYLNESAFVSTHQLFAVWNAIEELSADPAFAIKMVRDTPSSNTNWRSSLRYMRLTFVTDLRGLHASSAYAVPTNFASKNTTVLFHLRFSGLPARGRLPIFQWRRVLPW